ATCQPRGRAEPLGPVPLGPEFALYSILFLIMFLILPGDHRVATWSREKERPRRGSCSEVVTLVGTSLHIPFQTNSSIADLDHPWVGRLPNLLQGNAVLTSLKIGAI